MEEKMSVRIEPVDVLTTNTSWPIVYQDVLEVGTPQSNVGVCTLWTHRKVIARKLKPTDYAVVGNLYGTGGISPLIRNIYANPNIRYIVLCGNDLSGSGDALVEFMNDGVTDSYRTRSGRVRIESEIDKGAINTLQSSVSLIDLRGVVHDKVVEVVRTLPQLPPFSEPRFFPVSETKAAETYISEDSGFRVSGEKIWWTWLQLLYTIMRFGNDKRTKDGTKNELRELLNLVAVVTAEDPANEDIPEFLPTSKETLQKYYSQVLEPNVIEGTSYTYGDRIRNHGGVDQVAAMIEAIKNNPDSKRIYVSTWNVAVDTFNRQGDVPCLTQINGGVQNGRFFLTAHFRSQDMYSAWPQNAFSMRQLQYRVASAVGLPLGPLTMITHSAHIYAWQWDVAQEMMMKYLELRKPAAEQDPRGYIVIDILDDNLRAVLHSYDNTALDTIIDKNARSVGLEIARRMWASDPGHALYIGRELMKAEIAMLVGVPYVQDSSDMTNLLTTLRS